MTREVQQQISEAIAQGNFILAESLCRQAGAAVHPGDWAFLRGMTAAARDRWPEARDLLREAVLASPDRGDVAYNYGVALQRTGDLRGAIAAWMRTTALVPQNIAAWQNLSLALALIGEEPAALEVAQQGLAQLPDDLQLRARAADLSFRLGLWADSEALFAKLAADHPTNAGLKNNLALALKQQGKFAEAETVYRQALAALPPADQAPLRFNYAALLLLQGKYREGFEAYEARLAKPGAISPPPYPRWTIEAPPGSSILLWNDQGIGDALMFLRYARSLADAGYKCFALVQEPARKITRLIDGITDAFTPLDVPASGFDYSLPICSLPYAMGVSEPSFGTTAYIRPPKNQLVIKGDPNRRLRVGLVWAGNPNHVNDANRSARLSDFSPLFTLDNIDWYSLQLGEATKETSIYPAIRDLSDVLSDFTDTAAFLTKIDLLITVDTAIAHLAGAMGRPVWTLLPALGVDWRWGPTASTTPWYASMRLFRQPRPRNWTGIIASLSQELAELSKK